MDFSFFCLPCGIEKKARKVSRDVRAILANTRTLLDQMSSLSARLAFFVQYFQSERASLTAQLADAKAALADALANDAADQESIAAAQAEAAAAKAEAEAAAAKITELESLVAADVDEDAAIAAILDSIPLPVEPAPEPAPEPIEEPAPEEPVS